MCSFVRQPLIYRGIDSTDIGYLAFSERVGMCHPVPELLTTSALSIGGKDTYSVGGG